MRRALALALALGGCGGGASYADWSTARAHVPSAAETAPRLAIAPLVLLAPDASAPMAVLGEDGALSGPGCELVLSSEGVVSDGATVVLRLEEDGRVLDATGDERFRLEDTRLVRFDGGAAVLEDGEVRFEQSPALALRVDGAADPRTTLVVVAALATCGR